MTATLPAEIAPCLDDICRQTFLMMAGLNAMPAAPNPQPAACNVACRISIQDEDGWRRDIVISADNGFALPFAKRLFDLPASDISDEDIMDALKELANTVGGNLKGVIELETTLSIPEAAMDLHNSSAAVPLASLRYRFTDAGQCVVELCEPSNNC